MRDAREKITGNDGGHPAPLPGSIAAPGRVAAARLLDGRRASEEVAALYTAHGHLVLRRARRILDDEAEARDVLQEVFMSLIQHPEGFAGRSSVTTFLYSATTHRCLNRLRDRGTRARLLRQQVIVEGVEARSEGLAQVRELLARLPPDLAQAVVYYYLDEMTHDEIADQMGCSRRQVGNLLERAAAICRREGQRR